jgi:hypothetical protein
MANREGQLCVAALVAALVYLLDSPKKSKRPYHTPASMVRKP